MLRIGRQDITEGLRSLLRLPSALVADADSVVAPQVLVGDTTVLPYDVSQQHFLAMSSVLGANGGAGVVMNVRSTKATGAATIDALELYFPITGQPVNLQIQVGSKLAGTAFDPSFSVITAFLRNQPVGKVGFLDGVAMNTVPVVIETWVNESATVPLIQDFIWTQPDLDPAATIPPTLTWTRIAVPGFPITLAGNTGLFIRAPRVGALGDVQIVAQVRGRFDSAAEPQTA